MEGKFFLDIESGISEKLSFKLNQKTNIVTIQMIQGVISEMGQVEDIIQDDETFNQQKENASSAETRQPETSKRLFRDTDNAIVGGVAAGIANYFDVDPTVIRLIFVLAGFLNGFGILLYLILWLIVPEAKTTAEKYQMRGESVTVSKIVERVQEGVENIKKTDVSGVRHIWTRVKNFLNVVFTVIGKIFKFIVFLFRFIMGLVFTLAGATAVAGITSFFSIMVFALRPEATDPITYALMNQLLGSTAGMIFLISVFIAVLIPAIVLAIVGISILTARNQFNTNKTLTLGIGWIVFASIALSVFLTLLPSLNSTEKNARAAFLSEERIWRDIELSSTPKNISVRGNVSVHLIESEEPSLRILASDDTFREVHIDQYGDSLDIDRDIHFRMCFFCGIYAPYIVEIHAPNVDELEIRGNGDALIENVQRDSFKLKVSGAFDVALDSVEVSQLTVRLRGAHSVAMTGTTTDLIFDISGASDIFAGSLLSTNTIVNISGANTIYTIPTRALSGEMSGANTLYYLPVEDLVVSVDRGPRETNSTRSIDTENNVLEENLIMSEVRKVFSEPTEI